MSRYLCMMPLEFCGQRYQQNDHIEVPEPPSAAERAELDRLNLARALRNISEPNNAAMEPAPHQRGYKTRAASQP